MRRVGVCVTIGMAAIVACRASAPAPVGMVPVPGNPTTRYPAALADSGITGTVILEAVVDSSGRVMSGTILVARSAHPLFDAEAMRVLEQWRFQPAIGRHAPEQVVRVPFEFILRKPSAPECDSILGAAERAHRARTGKRLGTAEPIALHLVSHRIPRRPPNRETRTVAEFYVDTAGFVSAQSIRIISTTGSPDDAIRDLTRFAPDMRFRPAAIRGCVHVSLARHEFVY